ncbi:kinase non-catalytic C-lobe domain containing 1, transcript variant X1 [Ictidomys tridecemlineatus]|uniref:kinase non-catalytic C-lobe domain-containing protein 1 isoform X1 n=1 Tax=Ictidomys tridecemlineatus TaxID=43179 RepID=UPI000B541B94|nr:kinase non-catalytic C-lobe domain-containing protein 1 isoform X1 [Ictidomys tridecemlineatus]KAG3263825.1 kinase non-catalytic C-lobe domain containing 1, transcript variant X1 [Ictidomys tridecemlineatus]
MQAMDPAASFYEEEGKDLDFYDFEPLPTLPEDEENVSLADILSLRDSGLSEQEAWAVCLECSLSMRSVAHAAIFQTLCITPDTLAFNTSGNVCFMEQLSDDPEGAFVPPEFDLTGNTFEAHIYSLGATLKAALEYVAESELEPRLSPDLEALLSQMQAEDPRDRPDLESIIALCEEKVPPGSSCRLCRSLSAVGRRVLSIESFGAFQDVGENTWKGRPASRSSGPRRPPGDLSTGPEALPTPESPPQPSTHEDPEQEASRGPRPPPTRPLLSAPRKNGESPGREGLASLVLDSQWPLHELDKGLLRRSLRKVQTFPRLLPKGPEASALCFSLSSPRNPLSVSELFPPDPKVFLEGKNGLPSFKAQPQSRLWPEQDPGLQLEGAPGAGLTVDRGLGASGQPETPLPGQEPAEEGPRACPIVPGDAGREAQTPGDDEGTPGGAGQPEKAATEQSKTLSLQDLLSQLGRPFREYELWALCLACLRALQTHSQHPACLCLDNVLVAEDGAVLFGPPPANGSYNSLFLAPEVAEERLVTEKASVYCVAAVLWTAAKFSMPREQKLALPRRLKTLLLDMARRHAPERPSVAEAIQVCGSYLLQRGMDSSKILAHLRVSTCKVHQEEETISLQDTFSVVELKPRAAPAPQPSPGFLPISGDTGLVAVPGPVPHPPSSEGARELPEAFSSEATHFKPVVLVQDSGVARDQLAVSSGPANQAEERSIPLDTEGKGKQVAQNFSGATSLETPCHSESGPGPQGAAPEPAGDQESPCQSGPDPTNQPEAATSAVPGSPGPALPQKALALPPNPGPGGQALPGATLPPGPSSANHSPGHPCKPPRSKATEPEGPQPAAQSPTLAALSPGSPRGPDRHPERPRTADRKTSLSSVDASSPSRRTACPSLQEAMRLIREEFAFDGYLDNGLEALIMGEYIHALKDLTFATFCGAISEKFCDLYWDERLLKNLFQVVNQPASPSESTSQEPGSQPESSSGSCSTFGKRPSLHGLGKEKVVAARGSGGPCSPTAQSDRDSDILSQGNFEVGFRPQKSIKAAREGQPEVNGQQVPGPEPASRASDMDTVARLARPKERGPAGSLGPAEFRSCSPGWSSAFYEADCFGADVHNYVKGLGMRKASGHPEPEAESPELEQQLLIEKRNYRKTLKFYQKLLQKEKRNKGSEVKTMLSKLRGQLEEMKAKVQFLSLVKKYLQVMYAERWGLEPCALPVIVNIAAAPCDTLDFSPLDESSSLIFYNVNKPPCGGRQQKARILQAGTPLGLMAYLYSSDAFLEGYVQQFLYTFRYFCTPQDFLHFLLDRISSTLSRAHEDPTSTFNKIYRRSLCVLQAWVEDCYTVDFTRNAGLLGRLEDFISSQILPLDGSAKHLLGLLEVGTDRRADGSPRSTDLEDPKEAEEDTRPFNALCKRFSEDGISRKSFSWRLTRGNGLTLPHHRERQYTIASALPKPCFFEDFYGPYTKASGKGSYFLTEYSTHQLFTQLTLLQQELFQKCHPVHFLNSRALGVMDTSGTIPKANSSESLSAQTCSLFLPSYVQDKYLLQLLRNADDVSTWVAAEIMTSHTSKLQVNVLSKFLLVAKSCYEQRNFATAMQILGGLENLAVRQSPAWRMLPAKIAEVLEELKAVEVFLKSDSLCLMEGRRFRAQPTLPSARLLAMHIQQLETGGFTMTNGAHRWSKLRNIAKVVSQVHAFQENPYTFSPDPKLQSHLKQRIARFSGADIAILAADNRAKLHQVPSEKHSRKIQDKLRRMKATFQ